MPHTFDINQVVQQKCGSRCRPCLANRPNPHKLAKTSNPPIRHAKQIIIGWATQRDAAAVHTQEPPRQLRGMTKPPPSLQNAGSAHKSDARRLEEGPLLALIDKHRPARPALVHQKVLNAVGRGAIGSTNRVGHFPLFCESQRFGIARHQGQKRRAARRWPR